MLLLCSWDACKQVCNWSVNRPYWFNCKWPTLLQSEINLRDTSDYNGNLYFDCKGLRAGGSRRGCFFTYSQIKWLASRQYHSSKQDLSVLNHDHDSFYFHWQLDIWKANNPARKSHNCVFTRCSELVWCSGSWYGWWVIPPASERGNEDSSKLKRHTYGALK